MQPTELSWTYLRSNQATHDLPTFWHASMLHHFGNLQKNHYCSQFERNIMIWHQFWARNFILD